MASSDDLRPTFFAECLDLLESLHEGMSFIEDGSGDDETVNIVFRAVHSIKGGAGAFGFAELVAFAHEFETVLDAIRGGQLAVAGEVVPVLWRSVDLLGDLVAAAQSRQPVDATRSERLVAELSDLAPGSVVPAESSTTPPEFEAIPFEPVALALGTGDSATGDSDVHVYLIKFRPLNALFVRGNEAAVLIRALAELGELSSRCDTSKLPGFAEMKPGESYLAWEFHLKSAATLPEIHQVFEFADDDCDLEIVALEPAEHLSSVFAEGQVPAPSDMGAEAAPPHSPLLSAAGPPGPSRAVERTEMSARVPAAAPEKSIRKSTIRVETGRVDRLINLVGELVVNQAMLTQCIQESGAGDERNISAGLDDLKQLTGRVQDSVMAIRAQPIRPLFQRMARIVREAAAETGKIVRLETTGESTEIDKTVIEQLADPLTHMIRNAVDHGLENAGKRNSAGKADCGVVSLTAAHRSGRVIIDVNDDGSGIDRDRVLRIAREKRLVAPEENPEAEDIDALLFLPGFSTVDTVSNLSGRGVGMDVVRNAIRALGGRISIASKPGIGSTFSVSLPLTLAVLDGMVVEVADQKLVIPITSIIETLLPVADKIHALGAAHVVRIRDALVPIVDVGHVLGYRDRRAGFERCIFVLTETDAGSRCVMAIDSILDQRQVVIKTLDDNYGGVDGIAAATILGDGRIALILDPGDALFGGSAADATEFNLSATG